MIPGDLEHALEELPVPTYVVDSSGVFLWLNDAARRLVGDVRGRTFTAVVAPETTHTAREAFARRIVGADGHTHNELTVLGADGARLEVEVTSARLRDDGGVVGILGVVTRAPATAPGQGPPPHVTPRQLQILQLLAQGRSTAEMAAELHLTVETIRNHVRRLLHALDAHSRLEAVALARRDGLLRD